jgi:hypothetical protein
MASLKFYPGNQVVLPTTQASNICECMRTRSSICECMLFTRTRSKVNGYTLSKHTRSKVNGQTVVCTLKAYSTKT